MSLVPVAVVAEAGEDIRQPVAEVIISAVAVAEVAAEVLCGFRRALSFWTCRLSRKLSSLLAVMVVRSAFLVRTVVIQHSMVASLVAEAMVVELEMHPHPHMATAVAEEAEEAEIRLAWAVPKHPKKVLQVEKRFVVAEQAALVPVTVKLDCTVPPERDAI
jgi:hypothetical protein